MEKYHSPQVDAFVRLNTNESPFPVPAQWIDDVHRAVDSVAWNRYPDRSARALRESLARRHGVSTENVFVANGSNEVLQTLLLTYAGAGRTVATFEPTYQLHSHIARISGARVVHGNRKPDFSLDVHEIRRVLKEHTPHVTFLCSPNNPTGQVEPRGNVDAAIASAPGLVVVDEAYAEFSNFSMIDVLRDEGTLDAGSVVVTRTFSKTWSLAALRLGYAIAPAEVVAHMNEVVLPYHLDALKLAIGEAALGYVDEMNARVAGIVSERERLVESFRRLNVEFWDSGANFILFRPLPDAPGTWQKLVDRSVLVRDCSSWNGLDGCLRVTIGSRTENSSFVEALTDIVGIRPSK